MRRVGLKEEVVAISGVGDGIEPRVEKGLTHLAKSDKAAPPTGRRGVRVRSQGPAEVRVRAQSVGSAWVEVRTRVRARARARARVGGRGESEGDG